MREDIIVLEIFKVEGLLLKRDGKDRREDGWGFSVRRMVILDMIIFFT